MVKTRPLKPDEWVWIHHHGGVEHSHLCIFEDDHLHPESDVPDSPGNDPAVFDWLEPDE